MKGFVNLTHTNNGKINQLKTEVDNLKNNTVGKDTTELENYYTKDQTYTKDEVNSKVTGVYKYKGSVQTYADLPTQNNQEGDVYNVIQAYQEYPAGTNFAWTAQNTWDALGGSIDLSDYYTKEQVDDVAIKTHKQIVLGANGVQEETGVYNFTVENPNDYLPYKTNFTKFLVDLHLPIAGALDLTKDVAITFGDTVYYLYNILTGNEHAKIGSLKQVDKYNNETGYRFIVELTYFENADLTGFAIVPTVSMSDVLALTSDEMDNYMADGGLTDGQLAVCSKVITNGYDEGGLYRFDITYPSTFTWTKLSGSPAENEKKYLHNIKWKTTADNFVDISIISNDSIPFDNAKLSSWLIDNKYSDMNSLYPATGCVTRGDIISPHGHIAYIGIATILGIYATSPTSNPIFIATSSSMDSNQLGRIKINNINSRVVEFIWFEKIQGALGTITDTVVEL